MAVGAFFVSYGGWGVAAMFVHRFTNAPVMHSNFATQHCPSIDLPDTGDKFPNVLSTPRFTSPGQVPRVNGNGLIATIQEVIPPILVLHVEIPKDYFADDTKKQDFLNRINAFLSGLPIDAPEK